MKYEALYYRVVSGLSELAHRETFECSSKSAMERHVRQIKKEIASDCKYRWPRDVVRVVVTKLG